MRPHRAGRLLAAVAAIAGLPECARAEWFVEVLGGYAGTRDAVVTIENPFPDPARRAREASFDPSIAAAVRLGKWLDGSPAFGFSIEVSRYQADADSLRLELTSFLALAQARAGFGRDSRFPAGRFQPSAAFGFGFVPLEVTADYRPEGPGHYDQHDVGVGVSMRGALAWHATAELALLAEYDFRLTEVTQGYGDSDGLSASLHTQLALLGLSWRW